MKKWYSIAGLALIMIVFFACQKEKSFEVGNNPSDGTLQSETTGDCLPKIVNGLYVAETPLVAATNTIAISVNVTQTGTYTISSDTVNGYFFLAKGLFVKLGTNTVTLRSNGTPFTSGVNNFVLTYNKSVCDIAVTVLPKGSTPAAYTLESTATNCSGAVVNGSYAKDIDLNFTNTVKLSVNVTTIGTYTITSTKNGMTFAGSGSFTTTGVQTITLNGAGIPTVSGDNIVSITAGTSTCNFTVNVGAPAVGTLGGAGGACTGTIINGTYTAGTPLGTGNTVDIIVNVTTPGVFSITTNSVVGMSFKAIGTLPTAGPNQVITLNGSGTPTASGTQKFTVTFGTSTCTFDVPVAAVAGSAVFTANCALATSTGTYTVGTPLTSSNKITIPVNVTTAGTYNIATPAVNGMIFVGAGTLPLGAGNIVLAGTPASVPAAVATAPPSNIFVPGTGCTVPVTVTGAAATIDWSFKIGTTTYQGQSSLPDIEYDVTTAPPFSALYYYGTNAATDDFSISLIDINGGITNTETYNSTATTSNLAAFFYTGSGLDLSANPMTPGPPPTPAVGNMVFNVTSHVVATRTIIGTFSGTAFDAVSNTTKTITMGTFKAVYP